MWAAYFPSEFDNLFKQAAIVYPGGDWTLIKAQCFQESNLRPDAKSSVGAIGLCQVMPVTAKEVFSKNPNIPKGALTNPEVSIWLAAYYMRQTYGFWGDHRSFEDHIKLALAGYNAGNGYLLKAQKLCNDPPGYDAIVACLPQVPKVIAWQPIDYVHKIYYQWWPAIKLKM